jgi:tRNA G10  N-methylase Trm11
MRRVPPKSAPYVLAAYSWPTNAHLIADIARLGYLDGPLLDATYGNGNWWKIFRPGDFTTYTGDFTKMPFEDGQFDSVAYDPPYVAPGGRETSSITAFWERYGMDETPSSPAELQSVINDGLAECWRVVAWRGFIVVKTKDYITSGKLWDGTGETKKFAVEKLGMEYVDRFEHIGKPGPQSQTSQVHARRNLSTALVFRAKRPR